MLIENNVLVKIFANDIDEQGQLVIPIDATTIGKKALAYWNLNSVILSEGMTVIADQAFDHCQRLNSINLSESLTTIGKAAFYYCNKLKSITLPKSVKTIGECAFYGCGITSMDIPEGVTSIEKRTFAYCKELAEIVIPKSVIAISDDAFLESDALATVHIEADTKEEYERIFNLLPQNIQRRIRINNQTLAEKPKTLDDVNHRFNFFREPEKASEIFAKLVEQFDIMTKEEFLGSESSEEINLINAPK